MRWLRALLFVACVFADDLQDRKSKLPFIADAVGNKIPSPSNGPAPVGSPSNLLTPDRYEFYTFDESGELVKRLMTLEEIQAIVAAGEGNEGHLVTFANDDQPNIAFNFSQAPFTKVHNVVTNVQNVLKAQMEAQKNNPPTHTALDTPDVSDSWSLILPTIFGNTGAEIIPDKSSNTHTDPETDTLEFDNPEFEENSLSKEGDSDVISSIATTEYTTEKTQSTSKIVTSTTTTTPSTTTSTTTMVTTSPKSRSTTTTTTTQKPRTTSTTTEKLRTTSTSTAKPRATSTTTEKPKTTSTTTTKKPITTTSVPKEKATSTTFSATTTTTTTPSPKPHVATTLKPRVTTTVKSVVQSSTSAPKSSTAKLTTIRQPVSTSTAFKPSEAIKIQTTTQNKLKPPSSTTVRTTTQEKVSSFVPVSTVTYVTTERTSPKSSESPKTTAAFVSTTKRSVTSSKVTSTISPLSTEKNIIITTYKPTTHAPHLASSTSKDQDIERIENTTTLTTQSVSPSTTVSSTEFMSVENKPNSDELTEKPSASTSQDNEAQIPIFDIAQSISQITSDLGNNNYPIAPTSNNLPDDTKSSGFDLESKENLEMEIPNDSKNGENKQSAAPQDLKENSDNFVKISTLDPPVEIKHENKPSNDIPHTKIEEILLDEEVDKTIVDKERPVTVATLDIFTTIDPILSGSMDDLLSQVVNEGPQTIVENTDKPVNYETTTIPTTENLEALEKITTKTPEKVSEKQKNKLSQKIISSTESITIMNKSKIDAMKETQTELPPKNKIESMDKKQNVNLLTQEEKFVQISTFNNKDMPTSSTMAPSTEIVKNHVREQNQEENNGHQGPPSNVSNENKESQILEKEIMESLNDKSNNNSKVSSSSLKKIENNKDLNSISDQNKLQNIPKTEKISDLKPKIDEIKKKFQKVNIDDKELVNEINSSWKLISTVNPTKGNEVSSKDKTKSENNYSSESDDNKDINLDVSKENQGLEVTTKDLGGDIAQFTELCNELAFRYWHSLTENIEKRRSFVLSPYSITSMLAMMFMGAKGATSGEMNEILKLDDMVTFNPHFTLKNISDSIETTSGSGVIVSAFVRELYSDRNKGKILTFYKERAQHFYNGHVEEVNFKLISDIIRRRTNLLVKRYSWGRIQEYMKTNSITMQPPLAALSTNVFQTDCTGTSVEGRDGEMYFVVSPNVRQRRLVPVPAVVYKKGFLAGYDPVLDATAAALGNTNSIVSTLFLMPGQQGNVVHAEDLEALERRLLDSNPTTSVWNRLLRTLLPRIGLELQIPRFSHKSIFNVSSTLKTMGLKDLFNAEHADLGGLNGPSKDLYLSDMIQLTSFATCGEDVIAEQHHIEEYPESLDVTRRRRTSRWANGWDEPRDYQRAFHDPHDVGDAMHLPLHLRPRQARLPARNAQPARLKFDRPFLFFVRHNPSGMILYVGRYNPRLLP